MFDFIPLAGAGREMANLQCQSQFISEGLQGFLPQTVATTVAPAAIGGNQQPFCLRISLHSHLQPPAPNAGDGELGRVVIDPDADPTGVVGEVVYAVGNRLAQILVGKIVDVDLLRDSFGFAFLACVLEFSDQFLLLRINRDDGLILSPHGERPFVDMLELGIPIRMVRSFPRLPIGLQTEACSENYKVGLMFDRAISPFLGLGPGL